MSHCRRSFWRFVAQQAQGSMLLLGIRLCWQRGSSGAVSPLPWGGGHGEALVDWPRGTSDRSRDKARQRRAAPCPASHRGRLVAIDPSTHGKLPCPHAVTVPSTCSPRRAEGTKQTLCRVPSVLPAAKLVQSFAFWGARWVLPPRQAAGWRVDLRAARRAGLGALAAMAGAGATESPGLTSGRQPDFRRLRHSRPRGCDCSAAPPQASAPPRPACKSTETCWGESGA